MAEWNRVREAYSKAYRRQAASGSGADDAPVSYAYAKEMGFYDKVLEDRNTYVISIKSQALIAHYRRKSSLDSQYAPKEKKTKEKEDEEEEEESIKESSSQYDLFEDTSTTTSVKKEKLKKKELKKPLWETPSSSKRRKSDLDVSKLMNVITVDEDDNEEGM